MAGRKGAVMQGYPAICPKAELSRAQSSTLPGIGVPGVSLSSSGIGSGGCAPVARLPARINWPPIPMCLRCRSKSRLRSLERRVKERCMPAYRTPSKRACTRTAFTLLQLRMR